MATAAPSPRDDGCDGDHDFGVTAIRLSTVNNRKAVSNQELFKATKCEEVNVCDWIPSDRCSSPYLDWYLCIEHTAGRKVGPETLQDCARSIHMLQHMAAHDHVECMVRRKIINRIAETLDPRQRITVIVDYIASSASAMKGSMILPLPPP